jgi:hypothetical protein
MWFVPAMRSSRQNTEDKEEKKDKVHKIYCPRNVFVRFVFLAAASLFFRTGSSRETIPFVPDGPGSPSP